MIFIQYEFTREHTKDYRNNGDGFNNKAVVV